MSGTIYTTRLSACPILSRPSYSGELISQLLFGERAVALGNKKGNWINIKCTYDQVEGWADEKQLVCISQSELEKSVVLNIVESVFADQKSTFCTIGSELPGYDGMICHIGDSKYRFSGKAVDADQLLPSPKSVDRISRHFLNTPFLKGGRTPFGIDASGYVQIVFKCNGIQLPRYPREQVMRGEIVDFFASAKIGDLAFFTTEDDLIDHVGIILGNNDVAHVSGYVRIDKMDHYGIFNEEINQYTHRLKIIKRYF